MESREKYIPVFIDWKPAEAFNPSQPESLCMMGLLASHMNGVAGLRPYKNVRRSKKSDVARSIVAALTSRIIEVDCIGVIGMTNGQYVNWACEGINRAPKSLGMTWSLKNSAPHRLQWNGHKFHLFEALGISLYAQFLPLIASRAADICKREEARCVKLILDALPHNSMKGLALLNALCGIPDVKEMWKRNLSKGFKFHFGQLESYEDSEGKSLLGKSHPNAILADWFAASCLANSRPQQVKDKSQLTDDDVDVIASIWRCAQNHRSALCIDVDDPEVFAKVKSHFNENRA